MAGLKEITILEGKTGFLKARLEKVCRLLEILKEISLHPLLSKVLALKGGTAINLFLFDCPRLSIDLDFNFIGADSKDETDKARKEVEAALGNIFRFFRSSAESKSNEGIDQYYVSYETLFKGTDRIKVEVNYLLRLPLKKPSLRPVRSPFSFKFKVRTLAFEELYAAKCVALFDRVTPRDLFDVYLLSSAEAPECDFDTLKKFFLFYSSISRSSFFDFKIESIRKLTEKEIKDQLWPLLSRKARPVRKTCLPAGRSEMLKKATHFLRRLLTLNSSERQFFENFYQGAPDFSLLFDKPTLIQACRMHPMVIWKQQHLKAFRSH